MPIFGNPEASERTSVFKDALTIGLSGDVSANTTQSARVTTGDAWLRSTAIEKVDFLKIDVEGAEMDGFNGFREAFLGQKIDLVQFEYGAINLITRVMLADFYRFFEEHGFVVGKLYPEGVGFKDYAIPDEDFSRPIYVACHSSRRDIIEAIRCPPLTFDTRS